MFEIVPIHSAEFVIMQVDSHGNKTELRKFYTMSEVDAYILGRRDEAGNK